MIISNEDGKILKRIILLFKPHARRIIIALACIVLSSGIGIVLPLISKEMMDKGLLAENISVVIRLCLVTFLLIVLDGGIGMVETWQRAFVNSIMPYELAKTAFKHMVKLKLQYFNNTNFAEIMNNINMDIGNIARVSDRSTFYIIAGFFKITGGTVGLLLIDWRLTSIVVFLMPLKYFLVKYLAKKRRLIFEKYMALNKEYSSWYGDTIGGIKEIKLLGLERIRTGQLIKKQREIFKINLKLAVLDKINELSETLLFQIIINVLYVTGAFIVFGNGLTIGGLLAFITYSVYVTAPISAILNIGYNFSNILPSAKRFFEFTDMEHEEDIKEAKPLKPDGLIADCRISFENVSFSYNKREKQLDNISFSIDTGEKAAIIGSNGSGKTTVLNLLMRFYKPDEGRILIGGTDISRFRLKDYRRMISAVIQDLYLFDATIKENIIPSYSGDNIRMYKAAKESEAYEFIEGLPEKFDSRVGRNGALLSGGERQKVAMARAFARDSKIFILDEATSSYDAESERTVNLLLSKGFKDRTVIVVTHKPDILKMMDRIIVMENGRAMDTGRHEELYKRSGLYRNILERGGRKEKKEVI